LRRVGDHLQLTSEVVRQHSSQKVHLVTVLGGDGHVVHVAVRLQLREDRFLRAASFVEGDHVLAWALYKNGLCAEARPVSLRSLRLGTLDLALAAFSHASQFCPEFGLFGAPFLFESDEHFAAVFDGEVGDLLDDACAERYSIRLLATLTSGYRLLFNGRRPVETAADLRGLKIRVMGGEADALTWQAFGALPVPMPYSEVYSALQAGVIDGAENEAVSVLSNRFYEAARYFAPTNHLVLPMGLFISERTLQRLPETYRQILKREARETAVWQRTFVAERNAAALTQMQERFGVRVSEISSDELRERGLGVQNRVAESLGLLDLLVKVRAGAN
jgi:TRAP-type transport system periplasmic protein